MPLFQRVTLRTYSFNGACFFYLATLWARDIIFDLFLHRYNKLYHIVTSLVKRTTLSDRPHSGLEVEYPEKSV